MLATFRYVAVFLMETAARWTPLTPELEVKLLFGRHLWEFAQHADMLGQRTARAARRPALHAAADRGVQTVLDEKADIRDRRRTGHQQCTMCSCRICPAVSRRSCATPIRCWTSRPSGSSSASWPISRGFRWSGANCWPRCRAGGRRRLDGAARAGSRRIPSSRFPALQGGEGMNALAAQGRAGCRAGGRPGARTLLQGGPYRRRDGGLARHLDPVAPRAAAPPHEQRAGRARDCRPVPGRFHHRAMGHQDVAGASGLRRVASRGPAVSAAARAGRPQGAVPRRQLRVGRHDDDRRPRRAGWPSRTAPSRRA